MDSGYHVLSERIFGLYAPKPYIVEKEKNYLSWKETQGGNSTIWGNVSPLVTMKRVGGFGRGGI